MSSGLVDFSFLILLHRQLLQKQLSLLIQNLQSLKHNTVNRQSISRFNIQNKNILIPRNLQSRRTCWANTHTVFSYGAVNNVSKLQLLSTLTQRKHTFRTNLHAFATSITKFFIDFNLRKIFVSSNRNRLPLRVFFTFTQPCISFKFYLLSRRQLGNRNLVANWHNVRVLRDQLTRVHGSDAVTRFNVQSQRNSAKITAQFAFTRAIFRQIIRIKIGLQRNQTQSMSQNLIMKHRRILNNDYFINRHRRNLSQNNPTQRIHEGSIHALND